MKELDDFKNLGKVTREDVVKELQNMGYETYIPRSSTWSKALIASNKSQTIYFLIRKRGIDFKFYNKIRETEIDDIGKIFTNDGDIVRNNYCESEVYIHKLILKIASFFIRDIPLDESLMSDHGKPVQEQRADYIKSLPKKAKDEMLEMYDMMAHDYGEDAYLGSGMWISSDGSLKDKGR